MKISILTSLALLLTSGVFAQTATFEEVSTKKKKGRLETYISKSGESFSVGDEITLGTSFRNENFDYILQNAGISFYPLQNMASGSKVRIKKIKVISKTVQLQLTKPNGYVYGLIVQNFEGALQTGEIKGNQMSSDEALAELKRWKDKLDLEIVTEEEYLSKKEELVKYIK